MRVFTPRTYAFVYLQGIVAPFWFQESMIDVIGHRAAEKALMLGQMYSAQEALNIGLVDKLVPEADILSAAQQEIQQWIKIPGMRCLLNVHVKPSHFS